MPGVLAITVASAITFIGVLHLLLRYLHDSREPPIAPTSIPFFGHLIGLIRKKSQYYVELRDKYDLPISTLHLPGSRLYVINCISLIPHVQKHFKTLAFPPIEAMAAKNVCGSSKVANDILDTNVNGDDGPWGYSITHYPAVRVPLLPGPGLDAMNRVMAQKVAASIDGMSNEIHVKLFKFISHEITLATTDSVYGPQNPFRNPTVEQSFWDFQPGIMVLLMQLIPSLFAKKSVAARETMTKAFLHYFQAMGHEKGSALIQARYNHSVEHHIPLEDIARYECGGAVGILTNTSPASFWMVFHLYSNKSILEECRQELTRVLSDNYMIGDDGSRKTIRTLDMTSVKSACPILLSTFQEVLRVHSVGISTRLVMEDHLLDGKYLLKKGSTLMIPGPVQHTSTSTFGATVDSFDHRRFIPGERSHNPMAFRAFGGGTTLCPGRHFATTEILAFTALMILRCDVKPASGHWVCPTTYKAGLWETTPMPDFDLDVIISPRPSLDESVIWKVLISASDKGIKLSAEDM
ncbi:cytochrome P450 [Paraphoma chrysanthemicola]|uniref:Cytochrome P450 n=1 Tax=Paraphoma chrysanthemicola TaxID=798071 RepID=A0A8K0VZ36_9PLEO|nr:cytochrome P450 [Paraphoma chrysanthemicola]